MSNAGQILKFGAMILQSLPKLTSWEMQKWIEAPHILSLLLEKSFQYPFNSDYEIPITIDSSETFVERIHAGGFDWIDDDINESNFPIGALSQGKANYNLSCLCFYTEMTTKQVLDAMKVLGYVPATIKEHLAFAIATTNEIHTERKWDRIISLGSHWDHLGKRFFPYTLYNGKERGLTKDGCGDNVAWAGNYYFLAYRQTKKK